jgi:hypothetical protein
LRTAISELNQALLKANLEKNYFEGENQRLANMVGEIDSLKRENEILKKGHVQD